LKYLVILLVIVAVYWFFKAHARRERTPDERPRGAGRSGEDMVRCAQCGVHLPRSESLMAGRVFYCTPEHRLQHQKRD
jgi:uncharacterized protein